MKKKKLLTGLLAFSTVFALAGCSSSSTSSADDEKITATITVWSPQEDQSKDSKEWLQTRCKEFADLHPNWTLKFKYGVCSEGDAGTLVTQDVDAAADVYMFANDQLGALIDAKAIAQLGGDAEQAVKDDNTDVMIDSVTSNGGIYGFPFTANTWFMYYNKAKFSDDDIKSLDTMLQKGKVAFPVSTSWYLSSFFVANGGTFFGDGTDASKGVDFSGDIGYGATEYLVNLMNNSNFVNDANGKGLAGIRDGSVDAFFSGSWDYDAVKKSLGDNFGAAQLPTVTINGQQKQLKSFAGSKAIGVNPNSKYPQVSVALAQYLASSKSQTTHFQTRGIIPSNTKLVQNTNLNNNPIVKAQSDTIANTSILQPTISAMNDYWAPADNFGAAIAEKQVTANNYKKKTDDFVNSLNK